MKTVSLFAVLFAAAAAVLFADDGSWSSTYSLSEGSLYAETENADIALRDEILRFDGFESGVTRAIFFFSNTTARDVKVQAGFPIRVRLQLFEDLLPGTKGKTGLFFSQSKYGPTGNEIEYAAIALGNALKRAVLSEDALIEHSAEYFLPGDVPVRREAPASSIPDLFNFGVSQDGGAVASPAVVIEAAVKTIQGSEKVLDITFHFRHSLIFKAGMDSRVEVSYVSDCLSGESNMGSYIAARYSYTYILGTGRTWKGSIGRLYLAVPFGLEPELPRAFARLGKLGHSDVYLAENYEPAPDDGISMERDTNEGISPGYLKLIWFDDVRTATAPAVPAESFLTVKGASSFLRDTAAVYTPDGVIPKAGFGPLSLFDGIPETAWCEGAAGDGIGEWVEFELSRDVEALSIWSGYNRSFTGIEGKDIDTYFEKNNRPRTLEIVSADGKAKRTLELADVKTPQSFDRVFLPKGRYKLFIRAVYKGTKWQDTCLGEIVFHPASPLFQRFMADEFLKAHEREITGE